jgi:hypothetical protein
MPFSLIEMPVSPPFTVLTAAIRREVLSVQPGSELLGRRRALFRTGKEA